jgi:hypothetical protein
MTNVKSPSEAPNFAGVFLDDTEREIVRMHHRISGSPSHIDELAMRDVAVTADGISRAARTLGWDELEGSAEQISKLARRPVASMMPAMVRVQLGQIFYAMDRQIAERRRGSLAMLGTVSHSG